MDRNEFEKMLRRRKRRWSEDMNHAAGAILVRLAGSEWEVLQKNSNGWRLMKTSFATREAALRYAANVSDYKQDIGYKMALAASCLGFLGFYTILIFQLLGC